MLTCSYCNARVLRQDCHRNRYRETICRACQNAGVRFTWANRIRAGFNKALLGAGVVLVVVVLGLLVMWMLKLLSLADPLRLLQ